MLLPTNAVLPHWNIWVAYGEMHQAGILQRGALSTGAGVDGRQPGYFLRQQSRARSYLTDVGFEKSQLFKVNHGQMENSATGVSLAIYLSEIYNSLTCRKLLVSIISQGEHHSCMWKERGVYSTLIVSKGYLRREWTVLPTVRESIKLNRTLFSWAL